MDRGLLRVDREMSNPHSGRDRVAGDVTPLRGLTPWQVRTVSAALIQRSLAEQRRTVDRLGQVARNMDTDAAATTSQLVGNHHAAPKEC